MDGVVEDEERRVKGVVWLRENEDERSCANMDGMWMVRSRTQTLDIEPMTHSHPSLYVRATCALVSCTAHLELNKTENVPTTSRISV